MLQIPIQQLFSFKLVYYTYISVKIIFHEKKFLARKIPHYFCGLNAYCVRFRDKFMDIHKKKIVCVTIPHNYLYFIYRQKCLKYVLCTASVLHVLEKIILLSTDVLIQIILNFIILKNIPINLNK